MQKPYSSVNGAGLVLVAMDSLRFSNEFARSLGFAMPKADYFSA